VILWVDGAHHPIENMRRDATLLARAERGAEPVLRLFRFEPFGITLGMNQRPERELDLERCAGDQVPWAPRPTGGRAIFHATEWTYSLAAPLADPRWGGGPAEAYTRASGLLAASLRRLGVPVVLARGTRPRAAEDAAGPVRRGASEAGAAAPCFASTARHELVLEGRKLVGSAQRRTRAALLQQGSLLLGDGHLRLVDYLRIPEERRDRTRAALAGAARHAGRWIPADAPLARWAEALMAVLPPGTTRLEGAAGAFLLTLSETDSYTASLS
jgi:lipoate-protein ligase A